MYTKIADREVKDKVYDHTFSLEGNDSIIYIYLDISIFIFILYILIYCVFW